MEKDDTAKVEWPEGLATAIDGLKPLVSQSYEVQAESQRRLWVAQDEVDRLKALLAEAKIVLKAAQRDYEHNGEMMQLVWGDFRSKVMQIPLKDADSSVAEVIATH